MSLEETGLYPASVAEVAVTALNCCGGRVFWGDGCAGVVKQHCCQSLWRSSQDPLLWPQGLQWPLWTSGAGVYLCKPLILDWVRLSGIKALSTCSCTMLCTSRNFSREFNSLGTVWGKFPPRVKWGLVQAVKGWESSE